jgi:hypothetical protein
VWLHVSFGWSPAQVVGRSRIEGVAVARVGDLRTVTAQALLPGRRYAVAVLSGREGAYRRRTRSRRRPLMPDGVRATQLRRLVSAAERGDAAAQTELAEALFCSALQPSVVPDPGQVREAVGDVMRRCDGD